MIFFEYQSLCTRLSIIVHKELPTPSMCATIVHMDEVMRLPCAQPLNPSKNIPGAPGFSGGMA